MESNARADALRYLKEAGHSVRTAETLFESGEHLPALRALTKARQFGGQATAVLIANCLSRVLDEASRGDRYSREKSLDELIRLVGFVESALCPTCRRRVAARLREK